jgi:uncharacterized membrane protein (DUF485 family)
MSTRRWHAHDLLAKLALRKWGGPCDARQNREFRFALNTEEILMSDLIVARIEANPKYHELRRKRNAFGWTLSILMLVVYFGYIALIAFNKPFLAQPIGNGVTTLGIPIGMGVIIFTIVITGIYVRRANGEYDDLTAEILEEASK